MSSLSINFLQASTQSKGSHVKSHAGLHKCFLFMETSVQPRGYRAWKVPGFSMDFLFREFFTLPRGSHGKSQILPLTFSSQGIHTGQKISWEVQGLGFPMEFFFYRGLYTLTFTDCMHLTDNPLHFNKRDWATCRNGNVQKWQRAERAKRAEMEMESKAK